MLQQEIQQKINLKTKPLGALGTLENLALQIGLVQNTLSPKLTKPTIVVFAGDHGIAKDGVSAYPQEVTFQMVANFLNGGAAINVFCKQNNIALKIVDAGVNHNFDYNNGLINAKAGYGTKSFLNQKAISRLEFESCVNNAQQIVNDLFSTGCNVVGFGEMGIGNTSSASMIVHALTDLSLEQCVGRGTGLNDEQLNLKLEILKQAQNFQGNLTEPEEVLRTYGGFEVAQMYAAMLQAYNNGMLILVDGFIASAAFLVAFKQFPEIKKHAIFCHVSNESGHINLLNYLEASPLINLQMRVGEGTGCAVAYPIIESAVAFLNNMASFDTAGVSNKA